jgi:hypothetical protein
VEVARPRKSSAVDEGDWAFVCKGVIGGTADVPPVLVSVFDQASDPTAYRVSGLGFAGDRHTLYINVSESLLPGDAALKPALAKLVLSGVRATAVSSPGKDDNSASSTIALSLDPSVDATWVAALRPET